MSYHYDANLKNYQPTLTPFNIHFDNSYDELTSAENNDFSDVNELVNSIISKTNREYMLKQIFEEKSLSSRVEEQIDWNNEHLFFYNEFTESIEIVEDSDDEYDVSSEEEEYEKDEIHQNTYKVIKQTNQCLNWKEDLFECDFELDIFQKWAVYRLSQRRTVYVAAPTSSGKTLPAEYCAQEALRCGSKCILTAPIKSISTQRYRQFCKKYGKENVGLITGDKSVNINASILLITTEILRILEYSHSNILDTVMYVVFDEVHYIYDRLRGSVYEESIIWLCLNYPNIALLFLSATGGSVGRFCTWIAQLRQENIYLCVKEERPVPLHFYGIHFENQKCFFDDTRSVSTLKSQDVDKDIFNDISMKALLKSLNEYDRLPAIIFIFSKRKMMHLASLLADSSEDRVEHTFAVERAFSQIPDKFRYLPEVQQLHHYCLLGIGLHHSGLLPSLKSVVEELFERKEINIILATETFALGVNMPAKSVIFTNLFKFTSDNTKVFERELTPAEFIQMAGRAGRRGLDEVGYVHVLCNSNANYQLLKTLLKPALSKDKNSQFNLTASSVLAILNSNRDLDVLLRSCLDENFSNLDKIKLDQELTYLKEELKNFPVRGCILCESYFPLYLKVLKSVENYEPEDILLVRKSSNLESNWYLAVSMPPNGDILCSNIPIENVLRNEIILNVNKRVRFKLIKNEDIHGLINLKQQIDCSKMKIHDFDMLREKLNDLGKIERDSNLLNKACPFAIDHMKAILEKNNLLERIKQLEDHQTTLIHSNSTYSMVNLLVETGLLTENLKLTEQGLIASQIFTADSILVLQLVKEIKDPILFICIISTLGSYNLEEVLPPDNSLILFDQDFDDSLKCLLENWEKINNLYNDHLLNIPREPNFTYIDSVYLWTHGNKLDDILNKERERRIMENLPECFSGDIISALLFTNQLLKELESGLNLVSSRNKSDPEIMDLLQFCKTCQGKLRQHDLNHLIETNI
eukprot:TRINITY_DN1487_c0_g1_i1.p1 TRINITY_DN1487_c0_g1~~TRINITY_DN1487_c0_g1_i1.p1  ORF type:complete len:989 (+),score=297.88 TRINITY_DN1487_c0_g1_i1:28-2967(+)